MQLRHNGAHLTYFTCQNRPQKCLQDSYSNLSRPPPICHEMGRHGIHKHMLVIQSSFSDLSTHTISSCDTRFQALSHAHTINSINHTISEASLQYTTHLCVLWRTWVLKQAREHSSARWSAHRHIKKHEIADGWSFVLWPHPLYSKRRVWHQQKIVWISLH